MTVLVKPAPVRSNFSSQFPINEAYWRGMSEANLARFADSIFQHYRTTGYPYYKLTPKEITREFIKARAYVSEASIIMDGVVHQSMHGLSLCWTFFPHHNSVVCGDTISPMSAFMDDAQLKTVIDKRLSFGTYISDSGLRKTLKIASGLQGVSNFRPTAAAAIYRRYGGGKVYDMSSGYGGRLLGALLVPSVTEYTGVDPSIESYKGVMNLYNAIKPLIKTKKTANFYNVGSEDYVPEKESLDICFTSPPYFNTEKYSDEDTQSYKKYPTQSEWFINFLTKTIRNCIFGLKSGGTLALNIANVKSYPDLEDKTLELLHNCTELVYVETLKYSLSAICKEGFKYEPIFVFKKKS